MVVVPFASSAELERLISQTTVEAAALIPGDNDTARQLYLRKHVQLRLLHLMTGQMDRALQPVPGIDPADQEFWQQMFWGMANYFDTQGMPDSSERATQTIAQLKSAAARLQEKARLELHNVAFCYKISGFGNLQIRTKAPRPGRNPRTGEAIPIKARRVVTFHASHKLKDQIQERGSVEAGVTDVFSDG